MRTFVKINILLAGLLVWNFGISKELPTTEEFQGLLQGCAIGAQINVSTDLIGSITSIYEGDKTQGKASISSKTEFLNLIPKKDRLKAYKLFTKCISGFIQNGNTGKAKTCRNKAFGMEKWNQRDSITQSSGKVRGGSSNNNWCNTLLSSFIKNRGITGKYKYNFANMREESNKDWKGHVTYNYHCTVNISWDPLYQKRTDAATCGTY